MAEGKGPESRRFGQLLRQLRLTARLTQEMLAERCGLSVDAISAHESGRRLRPHPGTVDLLADGLGLGGDVREEFVAVGRESRVTGQPTPPTGPSVLRDDAALTTLPNATAAATDVVASVSDALATLASMPTHALPNRAPLPAGSRMPLAPNPLFVGRGEELIKVAAALRGGDTTVALGQVVASIGLGGLGKTQLAVEFVHRYGCYFAGGVFWLSFASADEVPLQVATCAGSGAAGMEADLSHLALEERVRRVMDAWQSTVPRLLVFDNCETEALLDAWRPTSGGCRMLATSRRSLWSPTLGVTALPLDVLPRADSIQLLRRYRPDLTSDDPGLDAVADRLGDLPLALHLAGQFLLAYRAEVSLDDYLTELEQPELIRHASLLGEGVDDSPSPTHHLQSVAATFALCLSRLDREREVDGVAIALLARMACMAPGEPVPRDLLAKTMEDVNARQRADGLRRLGAVGLVEEGEGWLRLHRLLVHFVRQEVPDPTARPAVDQVLTACSRDVLERRLAGHALAAVIPHLAEAAGRDHSDDLNIASLCRATGLAMAYAGDARRARPWLERALEIRQRELGPNDPVVATSLNDLGGVSWLQRDRVAEVYCARALAIRERVLGFDHPDTAESLNDLGVLLLHQKRLEHARPLIERALSIREKILEPDDPDIAESLANLSTLLQAEGEFATAQVLAERSVAITERTFGPDHSNAAYSLHILATVLQRQGDLASARPLFERALDICERVLGSEHPETATNLASLAALLHAQGDPAAARPLFERALGVRERALGPDHPDTVATRRALEELAAEGDEAAPS